MLVVSPLIALMQDQVAQLTQMGISAGLLNSSLTRPEQSRVMQKATQGEYRLLYLSPERLVLPETVAWLQRVPLLFFVIDEAHCISEWGHEFRPDYRQLSSLRSKFPDRPIAAFTASATRRVRHDIIEQLQLRDPQKFIASFHRPNLRYVVKECSGGSQAGLLLRALENYPEGNIIIYAPTIARVDETVDLLRENGLGAVAYHGQMDHETRQRNQEAGCRTKFACWWAPSRSAWASTSPPCARSSIFRCRNPSSSITRKPDAPDAMVCRPIAFCCGRNAMPVCWLISSASSPIRRRKTPPGSAITKSAASWNHACRHRRICLHFGEVPKWASCGACDVCVGPPDWLKEDGAPARRSRERKRVSVRGGRKNPGTNVPAAAPAAGQKRIASVTRVAASADSELRERLREWRRVVAKERSVPAFVVMHDASLDELCRTKPTSVWELRQVHGFGEKKTADYGAEILEVLAQFR